jgi:hydrogenase expression/formation protein HypD
MSYSEEFRHAPLVRRLVHQIAIEASCNRAYRFMEFCGGHTHALARYGIEDLLPQNIEMIHGPGCPVCVLPAGRVDAAIRLTKKENIILCAYGDLMRAPGARGHSLLHARASGADIRMIYSPLDALKIAQAHPGKEVVFFAIGFETTTPPTALAVQIARRDKLKNFSVFCNHVLTPAAMRHILKEAQSDKASHSLIDGLVGPAHVSAIIGCEPYQDIAQAFERPIVIAGFEPLDILQALLMLLRQVNTQRAEIENQYDRAVTGQGNYSAINDMSDIFEVRDNFEWRGVGILPNSALKLGQDYRGLDAEERFDMTAIFVPDNPACECGQILRGRKKPRECKLFGNACRPETPLGACMVSAEGACAAYWAYGRFRDEVGVS